MQECLKPVGARERAHQLCCYGAQGCTAAPLSTETMSGQSQTKETTVSGKGPRQANGSEHSCRELKLTLSEDAGLQDLYLLLRAFSEGGYAVSVTVQATPKKESVPSLLDIVEQYGCSIVAYQLSELDSYLAARLALLNDTTPSSKQRDWFEKDWYEKIEPDEEPRTGCLGKLQEGRG